ncbi:MAG: hypothetical protein A2284_15900 [Deltaproteobacteria bacterium RIFOXYA12_FULL_61_11]|nr:MAG: hypothetical protein A2284_15900 [Deltaproteobacteria bacterium RIFOXYA12_FULL_61_11]
MKAIILLTALLALTLGCTSEDTDEVNTGDQTQDQQLDDQAREQQAEADAAAILADLGIQNVEQMSTQQIEQITTVVKSPAFASTGIMTKDQAAQVLVSGEGNNFAMLLTDAPLKVNGQDVQKVMIRVKRVELLKAGFEGLPDPEVEAETPTAYFLAPGQPEGAGDQGGDQSGDAAEGEDETADEEETEDGTADEAEEEETEDVGPGTGKGGEHGQADGSGDVGEGEIEKNANADDDAEDEEEDEVGEGEELGETERETEQNANHAGRIILVDETKEYDLLQLRDDVTAALGGGELPLGRYHQIRFILEDEGHYVQVGDETHDLTVPSGDKSGVKIIGKFEIKEGEKLILTLDFDAEKSIHVTGQGEWMMKPVIKIKSLEEVDKEGKRAARAFEGDKVEDDTQLGNKPAEAGQQTGNKPADAGKTGEDPEEDGEDEEPTEPPVEEPVDEPEDPPVVIDPDTNQ